MRLQQLHAATVGETQRADSAQSLVDGHTWLPYGALHDPPLSRHLLAAAAMPESPRQHVAEFSGDRDGPRQRTPPAVTVV